MVKIEMGDTRTKLLSTSDSVVNFTLRYFSATPKSIDMVKINTIPSVRDVIPLHHSKQTTIKMCELGVSLTPVTTLNK